MRYRVPKKVTLSTDVSYSHSKGYMGNFTVFIISVLDLSALTLFLDAYFASAIESCPSKIIMYCFVECI